MSLPLIKLGPGGSFTSEVIAVKGKMVMVFPSTKPAERDYDFMDNTTQQISNNINQSRNNKVISLGHNITSGSVTANSNETTPQKPQVTAMVLFQAVSSWLSTQTAGLQHLQLMQISNFTNSISGTHTVNNHKISAPEFIESNNNNNLKPVFSNMKHMEGRLTHESDTETITHSSDNSRLANTFWLFPDLAGDRRRSTRQQGNRVRARRSTYQKRRLGAKSQQGSLFVNP